MTQKIILAVFFIVLFTLNSCYVRVEACLDPLATNFQILSDDPCDECCIYPSLKLQVSHKIGEDSFRKDSVMINAFGQNVQISDAVLFLSDFVLHTNEGELLEVNELGVYENEDGDETVLKEDHLALEESSSFVTVGSITNPGVIDSISCYAGVAHSFISSETESDLFDYDTLYQDSKYYDLVLYIKTGALLDQDISLKIKTKSSISQIGNSLPNVIKIERADLILSLSIDYERIIQNIELESGVTIMTINEFELPNEVFKFSE